MRVEGWRPDAYDGDMDRAAKKRIVKAAEHLASVVERKCPTGTVTRPMYVRGPNKNRPWTSRDAGRLKRSVRVTQRRGKTGRLLWSKGFIRVYAGDYYAYYASAVESLVKPFMRTSIIEAHAEMQNIVENG